MWITWGGSGGDTDISAVTDSASTGYTRVVIVPDATSGKSLGLYYAVTSQSITSVTVTFSSAFAATGMIITEFSGNSPTPLDVSASHVGAGVSGTDAVVSGTTAPLSQSGELSVGCVIDIGGAATITAGTGWVPLVTVSA